jgi:hypothetical protein
MGRRYVASALRSKPVLKDFLQVELQWAGYLRPSFGRRGRMIDITRGRRRFSWKR